MCPVKTQDNVDRFEVVERDPAGRYVRFDEVLGTGACKKVYKGFDEIEGIEVAWNQVRLSRGKHELKIQLERLYNEANLLKTLKHKNVMRCYHYWVDLEKKKFNMITELFASGDLSDYLDKHKVLEKKAIKNWAHQVLEGLDHLHNHSPPIVHRDIKCENIFVNGNTGKIKIGDLGLATVLEHATAPGLIGTPGFIAPELYKDEECNQLADIYSFGMCMLQMVTNERPYCEFNVCQIITKASKGVKPKSLSKVTDQEVRKFIEKCLLPVSDRPSATDLLRDPFLSRDSSANSSSRSKCGSGSVRSSLSNSFHISRPPAAVDLQMVTVTGN